MLRTRLLHLLALGIALAALGCVGSGVASRPGVCISGLRCENLVDPQGIDVTQPRLSWIIDEPDPTVRGRRQTAYRILVATSQELLESGVPDLWDSGRVFSDQSIHIEYAGKPLTSGMRCFWKVRVWDNEGVMSDFSRPASWSMGLLHPSDWKGQWIGLESDGPESGRPELIDKAFWIWFAEGTPQVSAPVGARYFRRTLNVPDGRPIRSALCRLTADNAFTLYLNGKRVGAGSAFSQVFEFSLADMLKPGANLLAIEARNVGDNPNPAGLILALQVDFAEGPPLILLSDAHWKASDKPQTGWETTAFNDADWPVARQLGPNGMGPWGQVGAPDNPRLPARYLRRQFTLDRPLRRATAYVSGLGLFELYVNGTRIGENVLDPGLTEYDKRVFYVTHDLTAHLHQGTNAVGVVLGNGRYFAPRTRVPIGTRTFGRPRLLFQMQMEFADGTVQTLVSDPTWKITDQGPIRANNEYDGEEYDARMEMPGWSQPGFDDSTWRFAEPVKAPAGTLAAQMLQPIKVTGTLRPISLTEPSPGLYIYDMGQNMVGWCRIKVRGPAGTQIRLRHAETLKPDGSLYLDNIRSAKVTDIYVLRGQGLEVWEPAFTYHGFRYVELTGYPGKPTLDSIEGRVVNSAVEPVGHFECSNPLLNQIHQNITWGVRGNYRSFPTDCPQRDERQAWLGDRSAECKGETYIFDVAALYAKWMQDIEDSQKDSGSISDVSPAYWPLYNDNVTWPSTFIIAPGAMYEQYADRRIIARHYPAMKKWVQHMRSFIKDDLMPRDTYGDWCVPPESPSLIHSQDPKRKTAGEILGTTYFYYDLCLMERYARMLGKAEDEREFHELAQRMKAAFNRKYFKPDQAIYDNGSQTSSVLPLAFDMVPQEHRQRVFQVLADKIAALGHLGTGLVGGQWLMRVLSDNGRPDLAYMLASRKEYPSWGYMVSKGATTIWELWNGDTADPAMNSGNHVMLVGDLNIWFYEYLAGIRPDIDNPGFKHIILRPMPVGDLSYVSASIRTMHGLVRSHWRIEGRQLLWTVTVPANTLATAYVPTIDPASITEGSGPASQAPGVTFLRRESAAAVYALVPGTYQFRSTWR